MPTNASVNQDPISHIVKGWLNATKQLVKIGLDLPYYAFYCLDMFYLIYGPS